MRAPILVLAAVAAVAHAQGAADAERVRRAVVRVEAVDAGVRRIRALLAQNAPEHELAGVKIRQPFTLVAAGFVISREGEIVTPALHPDAPLEITVVFWNDVRAPAVLVGTDPRSHLALLRVPQPVEECLEFAPARPQVGAPVRIVGDGLDRNATSAGTVKVLQVAVTIPDLYGVLGGEPVPMGSVFAISGSVSRGAPGSPCLDAQGRVLGMVFGGVPPMTSFRVDRSGAKLVQTCQDSFVIPAHRITRIVADLREKGRVTRGRFGFCVGPVSEALRAQFDLPASAGAVVHVKPGSPAARAGFREHDVVLALEGESFADLHQLAEAISDRAPGATTRFDVLRAGNRLDLSATPE